MARTRAAVSLTLPPPIGGWDVRNSLADMPATNAPIMDNWFPDTEVVRIRPGYQEHATGLTGDVETLMEYSSVAGQEKLFAANGGGIFDVTNPGAVGAAEKSGFTSNRWQHTQMGTSGGQFLYLVNGADTPQNYNGTVWADSTQTGPTDLTKLVWCNLHQRRLWVGESDSLDAWYGGPDEIDGVLTKFPLGATARRGGFLLGMGTWTRDGGDGVDDIAVFFTSEGEAILYQGSDPASANTWALVGVFRIGLPLGRRAWVKAGSDLIVITDFGYLPMSAILPANRAQYERLSISNQIDRAVNQAVREGGTLFGWEPFIYPRGTHLIFNVPRPQGSSQQHVFNTITNAPTRYLNINALTWGLLQDNAYFGGRDGKVYRFDIGTSDNGNTITADVLQAFRYFAGPGMNTAFRRMEPVFLANGDPAPTVGFNIDYKIEPVQQTTGSPSAGNTGTTGVWGTSKWGQATWGTSDQLFSRSYGLRGIGAAGAPRIKITTDSVSAAWTATNYLHQPGGVLRRRS